MSKKWFAIGVAAALLVATGAVWGRPEGVLVLCRLGVMDGLLFFGPTAICTEGGRRRWERVGWSHALQEPWSVELPQWRRLGAFATGASATFFAFFVVMTALNY